MAQRRLGRLPLRNGNFIRWADTNKLTAGHLAYIRWAAPPSSWMTSTAGTPPAGCCTRKTLKPEDRLAGLLVLTLRSRRDSDQPDDHRADPHRYLRRSSTPGPHVHPTARAASSTCSVRRAEVISTGSELVRHVGYGSGQLRVSRLSGTCRYRWLPSPRGRVDQFRVPGRAGGVTARRWRVVGGARR